MSVSLCMIVRDEEELLPRCLVAAAAAVDELVVVDTGSRDRTRDVARAHGARVLSHAWDDDFAAARNAGLAAAAGDWVLVLDADEVLAAGGAARVRELTRSETHDAFTVTIVSRSGSEHDVTRTSHELVRLFRRRPGVRFAGRVHESVAGALDPARIACGGVRVEHDGYLLRRRAAKDKARRNLALLERQAAEEPRSAQVAFHLGSEHAALGDFARAGEHLARAWALVEAAPALPAWGAALAARHAAGLRAVGDLDTAWSVAARGRERAGDVADLVLEQALVARARSDLDGAEALLRRCLVLGDGPSRLGAVAGCGSFHAAVALAGVHLARGDAAAAEALLRSTLAAHPGHLPAVAPLVEAALRRGATPAEAAGLVASEAPAVRLALAAALREAGHRDAAAGVLRALAAGDPDADAARVARAELALDAGCWAAAAAAVADVADASPWAATAAQAEAFARLAAGEDPTGALARCRRTGVPGPELRLLTAWCGAGPAPLPGSVLPLLTLGLDRLLRAGEFERFGVLLPLVERVDGLTAREGRELVAALLLRHGLHDLAGDTWAAACEEHGPDAAALVGLARVAAARGEREDALVFAHAALELEPASEGARAVVSALG